MPISTYRHFYSRLKQIPNLIKAIWMEPKVLNTIDLDQFAILQKKYKHASPAPGYSKYLDIHNSMRVSLQYALRLGLTQVKNLRILDIGTGCGYFPYICRYFGHTAFSLDLDEVEMYNEIIQK